MSDNGMNITADGHYGFEFLPWEIIKRQGAEIGQTYDAYHYSDGQDLLVVIQPVGPSGEYYELGFVTPDQLRESLQVTGLLPCLVPTVDGGGR